MSNTLGTLLTIAALEELHYDRQNPRLPPEVRDAPEAEIFSHLYFREGVEDIISSLQTNGFVAAEPYLVRRDDEGYKVIEGNRRLTALKALLDPQIRAECGITLAPGKLTETSPFPLDVQLLGDETDERQVIAFLGYKHVAGARAWGPMEKARFIKQHLDQLTLKELADSIGAGQSDAKRWLRALDLIDMSKEQGLYDYANRKRTRGFGVFYTAAADAKVQTFLGLDGEDYEGTNEERLRDVLMWVLGEKNDEAEPPTNIDPVLPDSRDIPVFGKILLNDQALAVLRETGDFGQAKAVVGGFDEDLADLLRMANNSSLQAYFLIAKVNPNDEHRALLEDLEKTVNRLKQVIR